MAFDVRLPFRVLPEVTPENEHFWRGGKDGALTFLRCEACGYYLHPPSPVCPACLGRDVRPRAVSGRATVLTYTLNHQPWIPGEAVPYAIAIVEMVEQKGLRLTTNIVGCVPEDVHVGMAVRVVFEPHGDIFIPVFEPGDPA